jgi:hypothetical protein
MVAHPMDNQKSKTRQLGGPIVSLKLTRSAPYPRRFHSSNDEGGVSGSPWMDIMAYRCGTAPDFDRASSIMYEAHKHSHAFVK